MTVAVRGPPTNRPGSRPSAYPGPMTPSRPPAGFAGYLKAAIQAAGFPTPTHFARAVGTDPSVVLRWLSGEQRPTIRSIERIAPVLGRGINEIVVAAYPDRLGGTPPAPPPAPPAGPRLRAV